MHAAIFEYYSMATTSGLSYLLYIDDLLTQPNAKKPQGLCRMKFNGKVTQMLMFALRPKIHIPQVVLIIFFTSQINAFRMYQKVKQNSIMRLADQRKIVYMYGASLYIAIRHLLRHEIHVPMVMIGGKTPFPCLLKFRVKIRLFLNYNHIRSSPGIHFAVEYSRCFPSPVWQQSRNNLYKCQNDIPCDITLST